MIYLSNDILVNCIQKGLRSNWLSDSAKNIAKKSKGIDDKKKELNQFLQFLFINSNSNSNSFYSIPFQFQFLELELVSIPIPMPELTPALHCNAIFKVVCIFVYWWEIWLFAMTFYVMHFCKSTVWETNIILAGCNFMLFTVGRLSVISINHALPI